MGMHKSFLFAVLDRASSVVVVRKALLMMLTSLFLFKTSCFMQEWRGHQHVDYVLVACARTGRLPRLLPAFEMQFGRAPG